MITSSDTLHEPKQLHVVWRREFCHGHRRSALPGAMFGDVFAGRARKGASTTRLSVTTILD